MQAQSVMFFKLITKQSPKHTAFVCDTH